MREQIARAAGNLTASRRGRGEGTRGDDSGGTAEERKEGRRGRGRDERKTQDAQGEERETEIIVEITYELDSASRENQRIGGTLREGGGGRRVKREESTPALFSRLFNYLSRSRTPFLCHAGMRRRCDFANYGGRIRIANNYRGRREENARKKRESRGGLDAIGTDDSRR